MVMVAGGGKKHGRFWLGDGTLDTASTPTLSQIRARSTSSNPSVHPRPKPAWIALNQMEISSFFVHPPRSLHACTGTMMRLRWHTIGPAGWRKEALGGIREKDGGDAAPFGKNARIADTSAERTTEINLNSTVHEGSGKSSPRQPFLPQSAASSPSRLAETLTPVNAFNDFPVIQYADDTFDSFLMIFLFQLGWKSTIISLTYILSMFLRRNFKNSLQPSIVSWEFFPSLTLGFLWVTLSLGLSTYCLWWLEFKEDCKLALTSSLLLVNYSLLILWCLLCLPFIWAL